MFHRKFFLLSLILCIFTGEDAHAGIKITGNTTISGDYEGNTDAAAINVENALTNFPNFFHAVSVTGNVQAKSSDFGVYAGASDSGPFKSNATFTGLLSSYKFSVTNNSIAGILANGYQGGSGVELKFQDLNLDIKNNKIGVQSSSEANIQLIGTSDGTNYIEASDNQEHAIFVLDKGTLSIENMDVTLNNNLGGGLLVNNSKNVTITGIAGPKSNVFNASKNLDRGAIHAEKGSTIKIQDMDLNLSDKNTYGIYAIDQTAIEIIGKTDGSNILATNGNIYQGLLSDQNSSIIVKNMDIISNDNGENGIHSSNSSKIEFFGTSEGNLLIQKASKNSGIAAESAQIEITDMNIITSGNATVGFYASNGGSIEVHGGNEKRYIEIKDNGILGINAIDANSKISFDNMTINSENNNGILFHAQRDGTIELNETNVNIKDNDLLFKAEDGIGNFSATNSYLSNSINTTSGSTSNVNLTNTVWKNTGTSTISNYIASNVDIYLNTYFNGATGSTDKLIITDSSTGDTTLYVASIGKGTNQKQNSEILIVDQSSIANGNANAIFNLHGGVVDDGYWEYKLYQGDSTNNGNSWYLRSDGKRSDIAKTIANVPEILLSIIKTGMGQLRQRLGELRENSPYVKNGAWVRGYTKNLEIDENINSKMNLYGIEAGYDHQIYSDCDNKGYIGGSVGYIYTNDIRTKQKNGFVGKGSSKTPSIGIYGTWLKRNGWFASSTLKYFQSNIKMTSYTSQDKAVTFKTDRGFVAESIEVGKRWEYTLDSKQKYIFEPKVELSHAYAKNKSLTGSNSSKLHYGKTQSISGKIGALFGYETVLDNHMILEPFIQTAITQEFDGKTNIQYAGVDYRSDVSGTGFEFGGGLNIKLNDNFNIYTDLMYEKSSANKAISTNVGIRYNF